jgi:murein DD-endopeptidase MepM/ murein hydrolase activator NlpD
LGSLFVFSPAHADSEKLTNPANNHSYQRFDTPKLWSQAKESCSTQGGYLATVTSKEENDWIKTQNLVGSHQWGIFLGATDAETEGTWKWITGEPFTYADWDSGQPDNWNGGENYVHLVLKWNDIGASNNLVPYLCEWNPTEQQATENQPIYSLFQPLDNIYAALDSAEQMDGTVQGQCTYGGYCNRTALSSAHNGVDYMVAKGTPVYAICDGTVKVAAKGGALANRFTVIDHSGCGEFAKLFAYYGQIEPSVKVGDKVESGDQIGVVSDGKANSHLQLSLNSSYLKEYGYSNVKKSTAKDCKKDTVLARRKLLDAKGWIDPITVAMGAGWNPVLLKGGSKDCNATEQLYTDKSLPYSPWK